MFTAPIKVLVQAARDVWNDRANVILANMVAVIAILTMVFAPPAIFGLFYMANRLAAGQKTGLTGLVKGGRTYFIKSWLWAILTILVFLIVSVNLSFYERAPAPWGLALQYFFVFVLLVWLVVQFYALAYLMEMEDPNLRLALRNGWFTLMASPGYTLVLVLLAGLTIAVSTVLIIPILMFTPCLLACLFTRAVQERLAALGVRKFQSPDP